VWAADFRDRIVHHLLYNQVAPRFHASFDAGSCACIPGRGTLYAAPSASRPGAQHHAELERPAHYLKCDLANFFVAIDKNVLRAARSEDARAVVALAGRDDPVPRSARGRRAARPRRALAWCRRTRACSTRRPTRACRSATSAASSSRTSTSTRWTSSASTSCARGTTCATSTTSSCCTNRAPGCRRRTTGSASSCPKRLGAHLNDSKTILQPVDRGIDFVGQVVKPWRRTTRRRAQRIGNVMKRLREALEFMRSTNRLDGWDWLNDWISGSPPHNVAVGATIVNQEEADRDIPKLLATPARVRFLSMEPLLGPVDLPSARAFGLHGFGRSERGASTG
jgi:RNA-directed DNA polymerase